jgi:uncharacterized iron-regulated membrane protein
MLQRLPASRRPALPWLRGLASRAFLVLLHRYAGLSLAVFLAFAGLTGSAIVFSEELDALLNPRLFHTASQGPVLAPSELARRVEQALPGARVTYIPLRRKGDETFVLGVGPKPGATLDYDEAFADPVSGRVLGTRRWGQCCFSRLHLMPFLYVAHYTLQLPDTWGVLFMGIVGIVWTLDCFVGFALTLPRGKPFWRKWSPAWRIKPKAGRYRFHLDLHRAGGLWFWVVLLVLASSGVAMNLPEQVARPLVSLFSTLKPSLEERAAARAHEPAGPPKLSFEAAIAAASYAAAASGLDPSPLYVFHEAEAGAYGLGFPPRGGDGKTGLGASFLYVDDRTGAVIDRDIAGRGSAGDIYLQSQYQLHTGRILGLPGRILVFVSGLLVALLSFTGVYVWLRKRRAALSAP